MPLTSGTHLGVYEVTALIGVGGMGEVYRATDTNLKRAVAIKVLPALVAADAERLARFQREAEVLAALNHPNIAAVYGLERSSATTALVMELVEGDDLSQRIARGAIPLDEALPIAKQIAEALEAAHEQGIIHRDLKPANIKVRDDGTVKVLDFGLAKAMDPAGASNANVANSPTLTAHATAMGVIIGTAAYMAPEQARGKAVDRRADIWAFGVVFYEMLTGRRAFDGDDISITLASVLKDDLQWEALPKGLPAALRTLLRRCLERDPKRRLSWIGEARLTLEDPALLVSAATSSPVAAPTSRASSLKWKLATALFALTTMAAGVAWYRAQAVRPTPARFPVPAPENMKFASGATGRTATVPVISPDGRTLAFTAQDQSGKRMLWVRPIDSMTAQPIPGTEGAGWPFWSPNSLSLGFSAADKLMRIAATGGPATTLCALPPTISARGGTWSPDGVIVFNNGPGPLYRVSSAGGPSSPLGQLKAGAAAEVFPAFLPDGRHLLFAVTGSQDVTGVYITSVEGGEPTRILRSDTGAVYDRRNGYLLFGRQGTLMAQAFDPGTSALSGEAFPIAEHLESGVVPGVVAFSVSNTGVLAYGTGAASDAGSELVWLDRQGNRTGTVGTPGNYRGIDLSPDGNHVAAERHDGDGSNIWITDIARGTTTRVTFNAADSNASPVFSPDGARIAYSSIRSGKAGVYVKNANNTGEEVRLFETATIEAGTGGPQPESWATDGSMVLGLPRTGAALANLWLLQTFGDRKAPLLSGSTSARYGQLSPDGKWIAYGCNGGIGTSEICVQPATLSGSKWVVSTGGGNIVPRWSGDSRELFYQAYLKIMAVDLAPSGTVLTPGTPKALFDVGPIFSNHADYFPYAVRKDGQRFLVTRPLSNGADASSPIVVMLNWAEGIRK